MLIVSATLILVAAAAIWDIGTYRIPNFLTMSAMGTGLVLNLYLRGFSGGLDALMGMTTGILILLIPFIWGGIGAGDVKLLAGVGALNGLHFMLPCSLYSGVAGGVIALVVAACHRRLYLVLVNSLGAVQGFSRFTTYGGKLDMVPGSGMHIPYGAAIAIGTVCTYILR